ncbi:MAG TPA: L-threonylcarbamoyladenylate synthase [Chloroflexota bacterium]
MPDTKRLTAEQLAAAVRLIRDGGVVAFPTDTVYGIGSVDLDRLYEVKERPREKRIAYLMAAVPETLPAAARKLANAFWPGALTIVAGDDAFRMPDHPLALRLLEQTGPLPVTSANRSGAGATGDPEEVWRQLAGRIDALLDGGPCPGGQESTVVDLEGNILRQGAIPAGAVHEALSHA